VGAWGIGYSGAARRDVFLQTLEHVRLRYGFAVVGYVVTPEHFHLLRGLALAPEQWAWSSFRHHAYDEPGPVLVNEARRAELKIRASLEEEKRRDRRTG